MPRTVNLEAQDARKTRLLDTVEAIVAQGGLAALTLQRVISESGISAGSVYHLFKGKDDILAALIARQDQGTQALIAAFDSDYGVRVVLEHSADELLGFLCDPVKARLNIELAIGARGDAPWAAALREQDDTLLSALIAALARDVDRGRLSGDLDPDMTGRLVLALWEGLVSRAATEPFSDQTALKQAYLAAIGGLLNP